MADTSQEKAVCHHRDELDGGRGDPGTGCGGAWPG